jgi:integrase
MNQALVAIRRLAREAAANGILEAGAASAIQSIPGIPRRGQRMGNWLNLRQSQTLLHAPDANTLLGLRDRALLAVLVGCALRRSEAAALTVEHLQERDGRWVFLDLEGKHGRIRTVPVPAWVKQALDPWLEAAPTAGRIFRAVKYRHHVTGESLTPEAIKQAVAKYGAQTGLHVKPHDLRRTSAKLCRQAGAELEQIQMLLGHASIQTTERYLGSNQDLTHAPNDRIRLRWEE